MQTIQENQNALVAPLAGAWIEIPMAIPASAHPVVAPLAGAWIEIIVNTSIYHMSHKSLPSRERGLKLFLALLVASGVKSLPSRERGLKLCAAMLVICAILVAPLAGAWIEILYRKGQHRNSRVAPLAGTCIEISIIATIRSSWKSGLRRCIS